MPALGVEEWLLLLIAGDLFAVGFYRRHASWRLIRRLFPGVAAGVVLGTVFVSQVDDAGMRRVIGLLLLALAGLQLLTRGGRLAELLGDPGAGPRRTGTSSVRPWPAWQPGS